MSPLENEDFMLLREQHVLVLTGRYLPATLATTRDQWRR
jgi:hypothetical protein